MEPPKLTVRESFLTPSESLRRETLRQLAAGWLRLAAEQARA